MRFRTPAWQIPIPPEMTEFPPFKDRFYRLNETHGEYHAEEHGFFVSANDASIVASKDFESKEELTALGFGDGASRCSEEKAKANFEARHIVMQSVPTSAMLSTTSSRVWSPSCAQRKGEGIRYPS